MNFSVALSGLLCWGHGGFGWLLVLPGAGFPMGLLLMYFWIQYVCGLSCPGQQTSIIVEF